LNLESFDAEEAEETRQAVPYALSFDAVYEEYLDYVWRSLKGLGIRDPSLDDAIQDVFIVIHRRLAQFEGRSTLRTWVFGIALRVARDYRRREQRKGGLQPLDFEPVDRAPGPHEHATRSAALRQLAAVLDRLDEARREVFVLAEIQELTAPEIAEILGINVNTAYSRIRAARQDFKAAFERHQGEGR
jgi:RNA polymerase sigma-70 factor (ECF subfamily)